jgi:hypothetical protein
MNIEVWRDRLIRGPHRLSCQLLMFPYQGNIFASWENRRSDTGLVIRVSDDLAAEVISSERRDCPEIGKLPYEQVFGSGYHYYSTSNGETASTALKCGTCGYYGQRNLHPRDGAKTPHPDYTYLYTRHDSMPFDEADWNNKEGNLTPPQEDGLLIIWPRTRFSSGTRRVQAELPGAMFIGKEASFYLLRQRTPILRMG